LHFWIEIPHYKAQKKKADSNLHLHSGNYLLTYVPTQGYNLLHEFPGTLAVISQQSPNTTVQQCFYLIAKQAVEGACCVLLANYSFTTPIYHTLEHLSIPRQFIVLHSVPGEYPKNFVETYRRTGKRCKS
jgi:hypothetical protein